MGVTVVADGIAGRRFGSDMSPIGDEFVVNETTSSSQVDPSVTVWADGNSWSLGRVVPVIF